MFRKDYTSKIASFISRSTLLFSARTEFRIELIVKRDIIIKLKAKYGKQPTRARAAKRSLKGNCCQIERKSTKNWIDRKKKSNLSFPSAARHATIAGFAVWKKNIYESVFVSREMHLHAHTSACTCENRTRRHSTRQLHPHVRVRIQHVFAHETGHFCRHRRPLPRVCTFRRT